MGSGLGYFTKQNETEEKQSEQMKSERNKIEPGQKQQQNINQQIKQTGKYFDRQNKLTSIFFRQSQIKIIWVDQQESTQQKNHLKFFYQVTQISSIQEAISVLLESQTFRQILIICSGKLANKFLFELERHPKIVNVYNIFIFCLDVESYKFLMEKNRKIRCVVNSIVKLIAALNERMSLIQLTNFRKVSMNSQQSQRKYSYLITSFLFPIINHIEREQMIQKIVECFNNYMNLTDNQIQLDYPKEINYSQIIKIYFSHDIFKSINSILKFKIINSISDNHIMISDLYQAINYQSKFEKRSKVLPILYAAGIISPQERNILSDYLNSYIQFLSFLSTSSDESEVKKTLSNAKNTLYKIYIPNFYSSSDSAEMKIMAGYTEVPNGAGKTQVVFNIKTKMTMFRIQKKQGQFVHIELIYGLDQIIQFLRYNKDKYLKQTNELTKQSKYRYQVHGKRPNQLPRKSCSKCQKVFSKSLHLIGTNNKDIICFKDFNSQWLSKESFFVVNTKVFVWGMNLDYHKTVQSNISEIDNSSTVENPQLCKKCKSKVKCQHCYTLLCLCSLEQHDKDHLMNSHILVESDLPRFISLESLKSQQDIYEANHQIQQQITCTADSLLKSKDQIFMKQAENLYSLQIKSSKFMELDYRRQYHYYFNRGQLYRLREDLNIKITQDQLKLALHDYQNCYNLVKDKEDQRQRQSKALLSIGIIQESFKKIDEALKKYMSALHILQSFQKTPPFTDQKLNIKSKILNRIGLYYLRKQSYQQARGYFINALQSLKLVEKDKKYDQAIILNNLAKCLISSGKQYKREAFQISKKCHQIRLCLFGANSKQQIESQINFNLTKKALAKQE